MKPKRDFLDLADYSAEEILDLLTRSAELKIGYPDSGSPKPLAGRVVGMIFEKPSTRTRVSFEVGIHQLGGYAIFLNAKDIQLGRGEPIRDTARVLSRYVDAIVIRTFGHDILERFANWSSVPIINGLSDLHHPCQVLGDLLTLQQNGLNLRTMKAAWIGDGNNVANSWIAAADKLGFELNLACPEGYDPTVPYGNNIKLFRDPKQAIKDADVVSTDVWASMGQENEINQRMAAFKNFKVDHNLMKSASSKVFVLHCLPAHRGEEITDDVIESCQSLVWDQAENRLHVQKAVMEMLLKI
jgi:ornithine carbamoyltransferase